MKNEQYNDQMVDICQFLHTYVPGHEDEEHSSQILQKVLSGGDYLTSSDTNQPNPVWLTVVPQAVV